MSRINRLKNRVLDSENKTKDQRTAENCELATTFFESCTCKQIGKRIYAYIFVLYNTNEQNAPFIN
jgi:hypothetical protein